MPHEKRQFENNEIYHITTRRVGDELFFINEKDYFRGIFSIYEFNNSNPVSIRDRREERARFKISQSGLYLPRGLPSGNGTCPEGSPRGSNIVMVEPDKRIRFVDILAFCLMPNHIHLLLKQLFEGSISSFMQKLNSGFATFFKEKYGLKKKGHFYQDRFNAVHIENDQQLQTVFTYIHTNPIAIIEPGWKERGIANPQRVIKFLENVYRWSSYWDCLGKKNFPSVTQRDFLVEVMGGPEGCKDFVDNWVNYKGKVRNIPDFVLE